MPEILSMGNDPPPIPPENRLKYFIKYSFEKFNSLDRFLKLGIVSMLLLILVIPFTSELIFDIRQRAAGPETSAIYDLREYYPNTNLFKNYYLEGKNYISSQSSTRAVLWFEPQDQWTFKMYNSAPEDAISRCNYDLLSWWDDGFFRYSKTHHECPGVTPNDIVYDPPIIFLPRIWNSSSLWSYSGSSSAKYYQSGLLKCEGVISYTSEIVGIEQIAPNEQGIHWKTTQTTNWTSGNVPGNCSAGSKTRWQEEYWLTDILPVQNGISAKALKRSKGGNLDITTANWDVWFDQWRLLPSTTPQATPTSTPSATPTSSPSATPIPTKTPAPTPTPIPTPTPRDTTKPTISITSPLNNSYVSRNTLVDIAVNASDNVKVSKVLFYINGNLKCKDTASPYICTWKVPNSINANYTISAYAYDTANNYASTFVWVKSR